MFHITARETLNTPFGAPMQLLASPYGLEAAFFRWDDAPLPSILPSEVTRTAATQLQEYFEGRRKTFDLPLAPFADNRDLSPHRRAVWKALLDIPYGETCSYADLADVAGGSPRSVGSANGRNPLCIIVPCHRVIRKNGQLGGYGGPQAPSTSNRMLKIKHRLLEFEQAHA